PYGSSSYKSSRNENEAPNRYRYTGKERDEETGFGYHGARYFCSHIGRWTSSDPIGVLTGTNTYLYVNNRPTYHFDPSGAADEPPPTTIEADRMQAALFAAAPALKAFSPSGGDGNDKIDSSFDKMANKKGQENWYKSHTTYTGIDRTSSQYANTRASFYDPRGPLPTHPGVESGSAPVDFLVNSALTIPNIFNSVANGALALLQVPELFAKSAGATDGDIQQFNDLSGAGLLNLEGLAAATSGALREINWMNVLRDERGTMVNLVELPVALATTNRVEGPVISMRYTPKLAMHNRSEVNFLRFALEWAQDAMGSLKRGSRLGTDAAYRRAARNDMKISLANLDAMHPLDSVAAGDFLMQGQGTTYYFGSRGVNRSFGGQLGTKLDMAGVQVGGRFRIEFLGFPSLELYPPISPPASRPDLPIRYRGQ
ncbi:MAG: RHS repeat-associated core domain-containing protein, partial [Saprospiraceae bacterium]|nr:RHS repeat-associated core domain-containing protein [Saprospiraceae bacterium]